MVHFGIGKTEQEFPRAPSVEEGFKIDKETLALMTPDLMRELSAFIFGRSKDGLKIAAVDPEDRQLQKFIAGRFSEEKVSWFKTSSTEVNCVLGQCPADFKGELAGILETGKELNGNVAKLVDKLLRFALSEKASDMHIEPSKGETGVRFRVDGILHKVFSFPKDAHTSVIARLKILSDLKIDEYRRPQEGRIELEGVASTSLRVSTIPTLYGEKVVVRILDDSVKNLSLDVLGFSASQQTLLLRNIEKPFGMIMTSGPTGSGKTTTLYALLSMLKKDDVNISTLEDPIEASLPGVNQIQMNPRVQLTFASGLRALLRQDPDVIMVGEIRDTETVLMAANAAMTGHLVLSTMHTNDAPSAFTRFLEMKVEDFIVASIVNLVVAQRLVRRICKACAKEAPLSEVMLKKIEERKDVVRSLKTAGHTVEDLKKKQFKFGAGCDVCMKTGYVGRTGMFELLELNKEIHDLILKHAPSEQIKEAAEREGFEEMLVDGVRKVFAGETTFEEVLHATRNA